MFKILISTFVLSILVYATPQGVLTEKWNKLSEEFNLDPSNHSFCVLEQNSGQLIGSNLHKKVRLASTSKIVTSFMAQGQYELDYNFKTRVYWNGVDLHIEGGRDPLFNDYKILALISKLNDLGIYQVRNISFGLDFWTFGDALRPYMSMSEFRANQEETINQLRQYFNLDGQLEIQERLNYIYDNFYHSEKVTLKKDASELKFEAQDISFSKTPPFGLGESIFEIDLTTSTVQEHLKYTNSVSHNYIADMLYVGLSKQVALTKYMIPVMNKHFPYYRYIREGFEANERTTTLYTGSGLDSKDDSGNRIDNFSTCAVMTKVVELLDDKLYQKNKKLNDIMTVAGIDNGTLKKRLNDKRFQGAIIAKTGSLMNTRALLGKLNTKEGELYFGIFHQTTTQGYNAKIVQDMMVEAIFEEYQGAKKDLEYKTKDFYPLKTVNAISYE